MSDSERIKQAKLTLKMRGWTYDSAVYKNGGPLPVTFSHLSKVLAGFRDSESLLELVEQIPQREAYEASRSGSDHEEARTDLLHRAKRVGLKLGHAARRLGVSRGHLSMVLHAHRESCSLIEGFEQMLESLEEGGEA